MFTRTDLDDLLAADSAPAVSLYLPTHVKGREIRQDPIRLKNLTDAAEARLLEMNFRRPDAEALLRPARDLVDDYEFWRYQNRGLALFLAPGVAQRHRLPLPVAELANVGKRFHLKPLLPILAADGRFLILAITADRARLFEAGRFSLSEVPEADLPAGIASVQGETDYENTMHMNPAARTRAGTPGGVVTTHSLGDEPDEMRKAQLIEYIRRVGNAVEDWLGGEVQPLVLVADPEISGHFRAISRLRGLLDEGVTAHPEGIDETELHRRAYDIVRPQFEQGRADALDRFRSALGNDDPKAATGPETVLRAARDGRVDTLFLAEGESIWGRYDEAADRILGAESPEEDREDLLDTTAIYALRTGAAVYVLPPEELPENARMAAFLRY